jgi:serine palmitoyltransferase
LCNVATCSAAGVISATTLKGKDGEGWEGQAKLVKLKENANWLRQRLRAEGMEVLGDDDSPILPVMLYNAAKIAAFSRECLRRGVAVVVVGFPATPLLLSRTRVCVSASHTRKDLEDALDVFKNVANQLGIFYCRDSANQLDLGGTKKA